MDSWSNASSLTTAVPEMNTSAIPELNATHMDEENTTIGSTPSLTRSDTPVTGLMIMIVTFVIPGFIVHSMVAPLLIIDMRRKRTLVKQLLAVLSIADILTIIMSTVEHVITLYIRPASYGTCATVAFLAGFLTHASGALATLMSVERALTFTVPFWYSANMYTWKLKGPIILTFIGLAFVNLLPTFGFGFVLDQEHPGKCMPVSEKPAPFDKMAVYSTAFASVGFLFIAVSIACNVIVAAAVIGMSRKKVRPQQLRPNLAEYKFTNMLFVLSANFLICWTPLYVSTLLYHVGVPMPKWIPSLVHTLGGINLITDPIIYMVCMKKYRKAIKTALCGCCVKKPTVYSVDDAAGATGKTQKRIASIPLPETSESNDATYGSASTSLPDEFTESNDMKY